MKISSNGRCLKNYYDYQNFLLILSVTSSIIVVTKMIMSDESGLSQNFKADSDFSRVDSPSSFWK